MIAITTIAHIYNLSKLIEKLVHNQQALQLPGETQVAV